MADDYAADEGVTVEARGLVDAVRHARTAARWERWYSGLTRDERWGADGEQARTHLDRVHATQEDPR